MAQIGVPENIIQKMRRMRAEGKTIKQIAINCSCAQSTVSVYTQAPVKKKKRKKRGDYVVAMHGCMRGRRGKVIERLEGHDDIKPYARVDFGNIQEWVLEAWLESEA